MALLPEKISTHLRLPFLFLRPGRDELGFTPGATQQLIATLNRSLFQDIFELDIGGYRFRAEGKLLRRSPTLKILLSSPSILFEEPFLDRDGSLFNFILRYLEDEEMFEVPSDRQVCRFLQAEANYFRLPRLEALLSEHLARDSAKFEAKIVPFEGSAAQLSQWALPGFIWQLQIAVGTAGPHPPAPDPSGHCRTSSASSRTQWAVPDLICQLQISAGTAGPQPRVPDPSGHCWTSTASWTSFASSRSQWALPDRNREFQIPVGNARKNARKNVR
eukprot:s494_g14.t1